MTYDFKKTWWTDLGFSVIEINSFYWIQLSKCLPKLPSFDRRRNGFQISHSVLNIRQWIKSRKPVIISLDFVTVRTYEESLNLSHYKDELDLKHSFKHKHHGHLGFHAVWFCSRYHHFVEQCEIFHPANRDMRFLQAIVTYVPDHKVSHHIDKSLHICQFENLNLIF
jgi:hypothetical protein